MCRGLKEVREPSGYLGRDFPGKGGRKSSPFEAKEEAAVVGTELRVEHCRR